MRTWIHIACFSVIAATACATEPQDGDDGEGQFYRDESKKLRKRMAAKKKAVSVLCEEGIRSFPATKKKHEALKRQGKLPLLMPLTRPEG